MFISEIPFEDLYVGMQAISYYGTPGVITELLGIEDDPRKEDNLVSFKWENGRESIGVWHFQCSKVKLKTNDV